MPARARARVFRQHAGGFADVAFAAQSGIFTAEFDVRPTAANMDGVIGLSNGSAFAYTALATLIRFNSVGQIDVRDGGVYAADAAINYRREDVRERLAARHPRYRDFQVRPREQRDVRRAEARPGHSGRLREQIEDLPHREEVASDDVALHSVAGRAAFQCALGARDHRCGDVARVDDHRAAIDDHGDATREVLGDERMLAQALTNIVKNAAEAVERKIEEGRGRDPAARDLHAILQPLSAHKRRCDNVRERHNDVNQRNPDKGHEQ